MTVVIVANGLSLGAQHQWKEFVINDIDMYLVVDALFALLYVLEVAIHWKTLGVRKYFWYEGWDWWHILDFCLTILAVVNVFIIKLLLPEELASGTETLGVLRLGRLLRVMRLLEEIPSLAITLGGVWGSLRPLFWIVVALLFNIYAFAILFVCTVSHCENDLSAPGAHHHHHHHAGRRGHPARWEHTIMEDCTTCYQDLFTAMKTLVDVVVLEKWTETIPQAQRHLLVPFYMFVLVSTFGVMNVIIGVMVDATSDTRDKLDWTAKRKSLMALGKMWEAKIHEKGLGMDALASLSGKEQEQKMKERQLGIEQVIGELIDSKTIRFPHGIKPEEVHMYLDKDGDGCVTHEEFVLGVGRILLADSFQLSSWSFVNQGVIRRRVKELQQKQLPDVQQSLDENRRLDELTNQRLEGIEKVMEEIKKAVQPMNQQLGEVQQAIGDMKAKRR